MLTGAKNEPFLFRNFLRSELLRRCRSNPRYSLRAFAKALDYDTSSLSKIIQGKRPVGPKAMTRFGQRLGLSTETIHDYIFEEKASQLQNYVSKPSAYHSLSSDQFEVISDWYHYAILELISVEGFQKRTAWIARALGITVKETDLAIHRLKRVGLLKTSNGKWEETCGDQLSTLGSASTSKALRSMQKQLLEKAIDAMENIPLEKRDQSSMTMAIDSNKIEEAKEKIKRFRREMKMLLTRGNRHDSVYSMTISLFPLTKGKTK